MAGAAHPHGASSESGLRGQLATDEGELQIEQERDVLRQEVRELRDRLTNVEGHFRGAVSGHQLMSGTDNRHGDQGADWLAQWFGPGVTEPVRLHVAAKRYLCAVEPGYFGGLSAASVHTLRIQGGPMTPAQSAEFEASPWCQSALRLRRWDDAAKDPEAIVPAFGYYQRLLRQLVRQHEAGATR